MSFRRFVTILVFLAVFTAAVRVSVDTDTWWHLRAGQWILEEGEIVISENPFSSAQFGKAWIYPGWLAQVLFYGVYSFLGLPGLNLLTALMVVLAFGFVWRCMVGSPLLKAFVLVLAASTSAVYWSARPHILSFAISGAYLMILEKNYRTSSRWIYMLVPLMALWANVHGGFAIGFILIGVYLAAAFARDVLSPLLKIPKTSHPELPRYESIKTLLLVGTLCVIAVSLNPHGFRMIAYPFQTVSIGVLRDYIQEWQSPDFHQPEVLPFLLLFLLTAIAMGVSPRTARPREILLYMGFGGLALVAGRNIALFALVSAPILSRHISSLGALLPDWGGDAQPLSPRLSRFLNLGMLAVLILASMIKVNVPLREEENLAILGDRLPIQAVRVLQAESPPGPLLNSYNWGGYIIWKLYPQYLSFVDGRTDLFDDHILQEYLDLMRAEEDWEESLIRYGFQSAILEPNMPLVRELQLMGWRVLYQDEQAIVLTSMDG